MNRLWHTSILWLIFALTITTQSAQSAIAQDTLVTFYAPGANWKMFVPGSTRSSFVGFIYDGDIQLFPFWEGPGPVRTRFITLRLSAGAHAFSASNSGHPPKVKPIGIELEPGKRYFFRVQNQSARLEFAEHAILKQVDCKNAVIEAKEAQPLRPHKLPTELASLRLDESVLPETCEVENVSSPKL